MTNIQIYFAPEHEGYRPAYRSPQTCPAFFKFYLKAAFGLVEYKIALVTHFMKMQAKGERGRAAAAFDHGRAHGRDDDVWNYLVFACPKLPAMNNAQGGFVLQAESAPFAFRFKFEGVKGFKAEFAVKIQQMTYARQAREAMAAIQALRRAGRQIKMGAYLPFRHFACNFELKGGFPARNPYPVMPRGGGSLALVKIEKRAKGA